jgi:2-alkyl-3-oxoalkanoate reductase
MPSTRDAVSEALIRAEPEVVVHQLTALAGFTDFRKFDALRRTLEAIQYLEKAVLQTAGIEGTVLRYGGFYGPGTSLGQGGFQLEGVRRRRFPIVGAGTGVSSFIHIDDAATATLAAIERGKPGLYNIVDDDPAPVAEWLPALAAAIGAKPPRRVPAWVARLFVGEHGVVMMRDVRGASNAKAKRELRWEPAYPSWRDGFRWGLGSVAPTKAA